VRHAFLFGTLCLFAATGAGAAEVEASPPIADNSFFIEEGYNQEAGVIQHIQTFEYANDGAWTYTFTDEWPVPAELNQLSATLSLLHLAGQPGAGLGDVLVNYRVQAVATDTVLLAPRISAVLPTGDSTVGRGNGGFGAQLNLPLTVFLTPRLVSHWNLGLTVTPSARAADGTQQLVYDVFSGASLIWLVTPTFNLMVEFIDTISTVVRGGQPPQVGAEAVVNPALRFALNLPGGVQIVPGVGMPVGVGPSAGSLSVMGYLSVEHKAF